jgi:L-asparaginase/Glu-tRNA(Gln) amidotransferase subunit D
MNDAADREHEEALDKVAQKIADARAECMRELGVKPEDIAKIMLDEDVLGLIVNGYGLSDIQNTFKRYSRGDLVRFYTAIRQSARRTVN